jgi:hypothetical protein
MTFIGRDLVSNVTREISRNLDGVSGTAGRVGSNFTSGMARAGNAVMGLASLVVGMGVTVGAGLLYASNKAAEFQQTVQLLVNHANLATSEIDAMSNGLMALSSSTGYSATEMGTAIFYLSSVRKVGETVTDTLGHMQLAAELARVSNANLADATKGLATIWASGAAGGLSFADMTGQVNAIVAEGVMKLDDLSTALSGGLQPIIKELNIPLDQAGAALDMMTRATGNAASGATGLRNALIFISGGSPNATKAFKTLGLDATAMQKELASGDLIGTFTKIGNAINALPDGANKMQVLTELFSRTRGAAAGAALTLDPAGMIADLNTIDQKGKEFFTDWDAYSHTPAQNLHVLSSNWDNFVVSVGTGFNTAILPVLANMSTGLSRISIWLMSNQGSVTGFFRGIGDKATPVGNWFISEWPKVTPILGKFGDVLGNIYNNIIVPLGKWLGDTGIPWFENFAGVILNLADAVLTPLGGAFRGVTEFVSHNAGPFKILADVIAGMFVVKKVEDWAKAIGGTAVSAVKGLAKLMTGGLLGGSSTSGGTSGVANSIASMNVANMRVGVMEGGAGGIGGGVGGAGSPTDSTTTSAGWTAKFAPFLAGLSTAATTVGAGLVISSLINPDVPGVLGAGVDNLMNNGGRAPTGITGGVADANQMDYGTAVANADTTMQALGSNDRTHAFGAGIPIVGDISNAAAVGQSLIGSVVGQNPNQTNANVQAIANQYNLLGSTAQVVYAEIATKNQQAAADFGTWVRGGESVSQALQDVKFKYRDLSGTIDGAIKQTDTWHMNAVAGAEKQAQADQSGAQQSEEAYVSAMATVHDSSAKGMAAAAAEAEANRQAWAKIHPELAKIVDQTHTAETALGVMPDQFYAMRDAGIISSQGIYTDLGTITTAAGASAYAISQINWAIKHMGDEKPPTISFSISSDGLSYKGTWKFAKGGYTPGGTVLVGEEGSELVDLPKGSYVHPHNELVAARGNALSSSGNNDRTDELCSRLDAILVAVQQTASAAHQPVANQQIAPQPGVQAALYNAIADAQAARKRGSRGF